MELPLTVSLARIGQPQRFKNGLRAWSSACDGGGKASNDVAIVEAKAPIL